MRMHQIKILYILVPTLQEICRSGKKISFFGKTKAHLALWKPIKLI